MIEEADWSEWAGGLAAIAGGGTLRRAVEELLAKNSLRALWISGSRAAGSADEHSDLDIRIHLPGWTEVDFDGWSNAVQPEGRVRWRLSKLGPAMWNYECLFKGDVPIDLLVFSSADVPVVSSDSLVFKTQEALKNAETSLLVRETPMGKREAQGLLDGAEIDLQKFAKLFARGERLGAWFLLEAVRFSVLRLAYAAVRGKDCGPKAAHTLASLKAIRTTIEKEGGERGRVWLERMQAEEPLQAAVVQMERLVTEIAVSLSNRIQTGTPAG